MVDPEAQLTVADIDLIVFDFDGVLTDNRVCVFEDAREAVLCNRADGLALDALRRADIPAWILPTEAIAAVKACVKNRSVPVQSGLDETGNALVSQR